MNPESQPAMPSKQLDHYTPGNSCIHRQENETSNLNVENSTSSHQVSESSASQPQSPAKEGHHMITRSKHENSKPKVYTTVLNHDEPVNHEEAVRESNWKSTMDEE